MAILSRRMQAAANLVTSGYRLADVGTDHGYVPISLVQEGRVPYAYAMDINKGPLEKASANIRRYGLDEKITTILGDGLAVLQPGDVDSILIAGMGGELVIHILTEGAAVREAAKELILQPQSDIQKVRAYLRENNYRITEEEMILEDGKYYPMMRATKSGDLGTGVQFTENSLNNQTIQPGSSQKPLPDNFPKPLPDNFPKPLPDNFPKPLPDSPQSTLQTPALQMTVSDIYGPILLQKKHPVLLSFLEREHAKLQSILKGFESKEPTENLVRSRQEIIRKLAYNEAALEMMKAKQ